MSPIGIARVNNSGNVTYGNPRWKEMSGHAKEDGDCPGETLADLVHPDDRETMVELWKYALTHINRIAFEVRWGSGDDYMWGMGELVPEIVNEEVCLL
jgi:PAS domain S-box-containing protein